MQSTTTPDELSTLSNAALEAEIATCSATLDAAEHRLLTLLRELDRRQRHRDHGLPSAAAWLGWRIGLGAGAAREKVRVANALGELPQMDAALATGSISYSKVRAMTRIATPANEGKLLHMATQATAAQLERICRGVAQVTTTSKAGISRWLRAIPDTDGMVRIEARLHADEAALVIKSLDLARDGDVSAETSSSQTSKPDRADALVQVAESFIAGQRSEARPAAERHQLIICVRHEPLAPGGVSAETSPIDAQVPAETLRRLACDTSLTRVTVAEDATPLDVGRKTRVISTPLRRALLVRDGGCRYPGCTNRRWLDAHHVDHWINGGETTRDNLILLCARHHRLVHEGGFGLRRAAGELAFVRPDGSVVDAVPAASAPAPVVAVTAPRPPCHPGPANYNMAIGVIAPCAGAL